MNCKDKQHIWVFHSFILQLVQVYWFLYIETGYTKSPLLYKKVMFSQADQKCQELHTVSAPKSHHDLFPGTAFPNTNTEKTTHFNALQES